MKNKELTNKFLLTAAIFLGAFLLGWGIVNNFNVDFSPAADQPGTASPHLNTISTSTETFDITAQLPEVGPAGSSVVRSYIQTTVDDFATTAQTQAPAISEDRGSAVQFSLDITTDVAASGQLVSYRVQTVEYRGGANANSSAETFVFAVDESELAASDLIAAGRQVEFLQRLRHRLYEETNLDPTDTTGTFAEIIENIQVSDLNLHITDAEIQVVFSEYAVAPGAAGIVSVSLPKETYLPESFE